MDSTHAITAIPASQKKQNANCPLRNGAIRKIGLDALHSSQQEREHKDHGAHD